MKQSAVKKSRTDLSRGKSSAKGNTTGQRAEQGETQQDKQQDEVEQSKILGREENKRAKKKKAKQKISCQMKVFTCMHLIVSSEAFKMWDKYIYC